MPLRISPGQNAAHGNRREVRRAKAGFETHALVGQSIAVRGLNAAVAIASEMVWPHFVQTEKDDVGHVDPFRYVI